VQESNPYPEALELVHGALARFREGRGDTIRTTHAALDRLRNPSPQPPRPADPPGPTHVAESPASFVSPAGRERDSDGGKAAELDRLRAAVAACVLCPHLASSRTQTVFGVGNPDAELMFVGEAPGAEEDARGEPFVGPAGQLLTKIIEAMGLRRETVFIANVLKCRPDIPPGSPGNRRPTVEEMATCLPYLRQQIAIIRPKVLVALGATATEGLLKTGGPMRALRGLWHDFEGIPTMATYHPSYLLRPDGSQHKRKVWEDILQVMERLGMPISEKQRGFFLTKR
jgi:uracil-DNA glycosylase family 4